MHRHSVLLQPGADCLRHKVSRYTQALSEILVLRVPAGLSFVITGLSSDVSDNILFIYKQPFVNYFTFCHIFLTTDVTFVEVSLLF